MSAEVDSYETYYAICYDCGWEGEAYEESRASAQKEADAHECAPTREEYQKILDRAMGIDIDEEQE